MIPTNRQKPDRITIQFASPDQEEQAGSAWLSTRPEGELLLDVYQDADNLYVRSTMAGVKLKDLEVSIHDDMLTIHGTREHDETVSRDDYFFQECYWGSFSRSIILPLDVKADDVSAIMRDGVLTVTLPKAARRQKISINVTEHHDDD